MGAQPLLVSLYAQGVAVSGAKVYSYVKDTTTSQTIYTDSGLTTPAANPSVSDSEGRVELYLDNTLNYSIVIKSSDDAYTFYAADYVAGADSFIVVQTSPISTELQQDLATVAAAIDAGTLDGLLDENDFLQTANDLSDLNNQSNALSNLGISAFVQTILDDANAAAVRTTTGSYGSGDSPTFTDTIVNDELFVGKTSSDLSATGHELNAAGQAFFTAPSGVVLTLNRESTDGTIMGFRHAGVQEGSISISGTTVSYNGGHLSRWSQLAENDPTDPETIPKGTVMLGLSEMCEWDGEENEQLTRTKICDSPGSKAVAGVFIRYDHMEQIPDPDWKRPLIEGTKTPDMTAECPFIDDPDYVPGDFYIAQTGDFVIRVTGPCENGDLLESNGDGTARVQADDIQRSSTIAKAVFSFPDAAPDEENIVPCLLLLG